MRAATSPSVTPTLTKRKSYAESAVIDVNYFCQLATIILAGPEWAEDTTILRPVDLMTGRYRESSFSLSSPF